MIDAYYLTIMAEILVVTLVVVICIGSIGGAT